MSATARLKTLQVDRMDMDDLIELSADARRIATEREQQGLITPEWLSDAQGTLQREIKLKRRDELERRKKELNAQSQGLETAQEKRDRIAKEMADIDAKLGEVKV